MKNLFKKTSTKLITLGLAMGIAISTPLIIANQIQIRTKENTQLIKVANQVNDSFKRKVEIQKQLELSVNLTTDEISSLEYELYEEDQGLLDDYIITSDENMLSINLPHIIESSLDNEVLTYLTEGINNFNQNITTSPAIDEDLLDSLVSQSEISSLSLKFSARWVEHGVNALTIALNITMGAMKRVGIVGKKIALGFARQTIPTVFIGTLRLVGLYNLAGKVGEQISNSTDTILLRGFSFGGMIANIGDLISDYSLDGYITIRL